jgi:hypothetical protein
MVPAPPQRTPHHHQPLVINNPNHVMMSHLMNPLSISNVNGVVGGHNLATNNSNTLTDFEFYSNMNATLNNNNNINNNPHMQQLFSNNSNIYSQQQQQNAANLSHIRSVSINEDGSHQNVEFMNQNGEFGGNQFFGVGNGDAATVFVMRNASRPKPIAIPIGGGGGGGSGPNGLSNMSSPIEQHQMQGGTTYIISTNSTRKSFRNLREIAFNKFMCKFLKFKIRFFFRLKSGCHSSLVK